MFNKPKTQLKYFTFWFVMGCVLLFSIIYLSLTSHPPPIMHFSYGDKVSHFIAYGTLMLWFGQLFTSRVASYVCIVLFTLMGGMLEVLQWFGGVRFFEYADMLANFIGVLIGWWLAKGWFAGLFVAIERRFLVTSGH